MLVYFLLSKSGDPNKLRVSCILATALQLWYESRVLSTGVKACAQHMVWICMCIGGIAMTTYIEARAYICVKWSLEIAWSKQKLKRFDTFFIKFCNVKFHQACLYGSCIFIHVLDGWRDTAILIGTPQECKSTYKWGYMI